MNPTMHDIVIWGLILVSVLLVSGITYIYTNRNRYVTLIFTIIAILAVLLIKIIGIVQIELREHFLGQFDENNVPFITSEPGWKLLFHAWHIWILPVLFIILVSGIIIYFILHNKRHGKPTVQIQQSSQHNVQKNYTMTHAERLNTFMAMDAAKKDARETHEKLAEATLTNTAYEIKISDLTTKAKQLEKDLVETRKKLQEEIETLELELSAKNKENEYISNQLSERSRELIRAQEMFEKLAVLHRKSQTEK